MTSEVLSQNLGIPDMPGYSETKRGVCYPLETTTIKVNCSGRNREKLNTRETLTDLQI